MLSKIKRLKVFANAHNLVDYALRANPPYMLSCAIRHVGWIKREARIHHLKYIVVCGLIFSVAHALELVQGKHYRILPQPKQLSAKVNGKVDVIEFFSFTCPWCHKLDPTLTAWLTQHRQQIHFRRVPVEFRDSWVQLAKAYYVAKALKIEKTIIPALFAAQQPFGHEKAMPLKTIAQVFDKAGIKNKVFYQAMRLSPTIDTQLGEGRSLANKLRINQIPTVIVAGRWITDPQMAGSFEAFSEVLTAMVNKAQALSS